MATHTFFVTGMHCQACTLLTESELGDLAFVTSAKSSLESETVQVTGDFGDGTPEEIAKRLSLVLEKRGYSLSVEKPKRGKKWGEFAYAVPIAVAFALGFVLLQKAGMINFIAVNKFSYGTAFAVGVVASLSTCMAVVGGLVLSLSATFAKGGDRTQPQLMFHAGRIVAFAVLGGVIGALGASFQLGSSAMLVLGVAVGIVMLILGVNLLDVFDWAKKLQPSMPKFLSKRALGAAKMHHALTPLLVGAATFFLPCGFTQSIQLYALTTGSFLKGGLTLLSFALGTLPVLALISFSSFSVEKSSRRGIFFKSAGLIVILFAIFNITNSLVAAGYLPPVFNF